MDKKPFLQLGKCWQGQTHFVVWQVQCPLEGLPKKFYLVLDAHQVSRGAHLKTDKPGNLREQGAIANLLRKYVPNGTLGEVLEDQASKDLWFPVRPSPNKEPVCYLLLDKGTPPFLSLIMATGEVIFRFGQKGTFTHKKTYEGSLASDLAGKSLVDILPRLLSSCAAPASSVRATTKYEEDLTNVSELQRDAKHKLARRFKTVKAALAKLETNLPSLASVQELELKAQLLQSYAYLLKEGMSELKLDEFQTGVGAPLEIALDPDLSPGKNLEEAFIHLKKQKRALTLGQERYEKSRKECEQMQSDLELLRGEPLADRVVLGILARHHIALENQDANVSKRKDKAEPALPYKVYCGEGKVRYLVGKGPSENDRLTKAARSNDYWFHTVGITGSHVVVPYKSLSGGQLTEKAKREAAILAVHFSKVRSDRAGEVYVTQRQFLRKQKGLPVGLWLVDKSETLFVRYETDELQVVLDRAGT